MFSNGSSSSMSRAIVTPSLVIVGEPNFLSSTTLRPLGPIVTLTASASLSMPRLSERRAVSSKMSCLDNVSVLLESLRLKSARRPRRSVLDDREDVLLADDEELLALDLELGPGVLGVEDLVALLDVHGLALAVLEDPAGADGEDVPSWGFSLAVSGRTMPLLVISSRADGWITTRSPSGRSFVAVTVAVANVHSSCDGSRAAVEP